MVKLCKEKYKWNTAAVKKCIAGGDRDRIQAQRMWFWNEGLTIHFTGVFISNLILSECSSPADTPRPRCPGRPRSLSPASPLSQHQEQKQRGRGAGQIQTIRSHLQEERDERARKAKVILGLDLMVILASSYTRTTKPEHFCVMWASGLL